MLELKRALYEALKAKEASAEGVTSLEFDLLVLLAEDLCV